MNYIVFDEGYIRKNIENTYKFVFPNRKREDILHFFIHGDIVKTTIPTYQGGNKEDYFFRVHFSFIVVAENKDVWESFFTVYYDTETYLPYHKEQTGCRNLSDYAKYKAKGE